MNRKFIWIFLALVVALGIGCRTSLIRNVESAPVSLYGEEKVTMQQVEKAIIRAGAGLGWRMKALSPGKMVGTLVIRDHVAVVDIKFNTKEYSITYKDSTNLKYDGTKIHSNYNGWVQNLERSINAQFSTL